MNLERLIEAGEEKGFEVEQDADYGAGPVDVVWNINVHPALPNIKFGFIVLGGEEEGGSQDIEDNQLSIRSGLIRYISSQKIKRWQSLSAAR
jgi:hypothetical protein